MKINYPIPIRAKLVLIVLIFAIVPMLLLTMVWYNTSVERNAAVVRLGLEARAQEIVRQLQRLRNSGQELSWDAAVGPRTAALTRRYLPNQNEIVLSIREVVILDAQRVVRYAANRDWEGKPYQTALPPLIAQVFTNLLEEQQTQHSSFPGLFQGDLRNRYFLDNQYWMIYLHQSGGTEPLSIFVIEQDVGRGLLDVAGLSILGITFLLAIVATLLVYLIISGTTDSIRRVTRGAKAIAAGKLDATITVKSNDETKVLADAFNRMAGRLREMIARESEQKQFESFARLSSVLTHDLKNAILSLSFLVTNMERKFDREGFREDAMRTLADSVGNLKNLVSKLSDPLTQPNEDRSEQDLSQLVERVLLRTAQHVGERYIVTTDLTPEVKSIVNPSAIERVVENLIINALEAMPDGGALKIFTEAAGQQGVIRVADTGKGMTPEFIRDKLFHPFATTKKKGIGLGLYSCRDIIEQHGGQIEVESTEGVGTEFKIILPLVQEPTTIGGVKETQAISV
ncbi:MAG TPA: HAMP domain-containing sensor histidine kinase [Blastocatellia bacterium]|nr:HAMP domain-containing sensor histidine kinase [Blastocatellia bacterium]